MLMMHANTSSSSSESSQDAAKMVMLGGSSPLGFASPSVVSSLTSQTLQSLTPTASTSTALTVSPAPPLSRELLHHYAYLTTSGTSSSCDDDYESSVGGDEAMYERWEDDAQQAAPSSPPVAVDQLDALVAILDQDMGDAAAAANESLLSLLLVETETPARKYSLLDDMIRFHITHIADEQPLAEEAEAASHNARPTTE
ncbi:hypothetical protein PybrP1_001220 [[Pythium] brassicae (nom. inval.)]|nr:hypothetical protein PybrP1_001220 [[Pythium] brassicae (nom. inval.)]